MRTWDRIAPCPNITLAYLLDKRVSVLGLHTGQSNKHVELINAFLESDVALSWLLKQAPQHRQNNAKALANNIFYFTATQSALGHPVEHWFGAGLDDYIDYVDCLGTTIHVYKDFVMRLRPFFEWLIQERGLKLAASRIGPRLSDVKDTLKGRERTLSFETLSRLCLRFMHLLPSPSPLWFLCWLIKQGATEEQICGLRKYLEIERVGKNEFRMVNLPGTKTFSNGIYNEIEDNYENCCACLFGMPVPSYVAQASMFKDYRRTGTLTLADLRSMVREGLIWERLEALEKKDKVGYAITSMLVARSAGDHKLSYAVRRLVPTEHLVELALKRASGPVYDPLDESLPLSERLKKDVATTTVDKYLQRPAGLPGG